MDKPILFSTPMVQAILDGRKTMTRRVVTPQPVPGQTGAIRFNKWFDGMARFGDEMSSAVCDRKPNYQPGDILWVRETWNCIRFGNGRSVPHETEYWYKADEKSANPDNKWRPSIFLPKSAARIWLRVTDVRVERLQDISDDEAKDEGFAWTASNYGGCSYVKTQKCHDGCNCFSARENFAGLWDGLNAKRGYGWDTNPWVWVISFERIEKPQ